MFRKFKHRPPKLTSSASTSHIPVAAPPPLFPSASTSRIVEVAQLYLDGCREDALRKVVDFLEGDAAKGGKVQIITGNASRGRSLQSSVEALLKKRGMSFRSLAPGIVEVDSSTGKKQRLRASVRNILPSTDPYEELCREGAPDLMRSSGARKLNGNRSSLRASIKLTPEERDEASKQALKAGQERFYVESRLAQKTVGRRRLSVQPHRHALNADRKQSSLVLNPRSSFGSSLTRAAPPPPNSLLSTPSDIVTAYASNTMAAAHSRFEEPMLEAEVCPLHSTAAAAAPITAEAASTSDWELVEEDDRVPQETPSVREATASPPTQTIDVDQDGDDDYDEDSDDYGEDSEDDEEALRYVLEASAEEVEEENRDELELLDRVIQESEQESEEARLAREDEERLVELAVHQSEQDNSAQLSTDEYEEAMRKAMEDSRQSVESKTPADEEKELMEMALKLSMQEVSEEEKEQELIEAAIAMSKEAELKAAAEEQRMLQRTLRESKRLHVSQLSDGELNKALQEAMEVSVNSLASTSVSEDDDELIQALALSMK